MLDRRRRRRANIKTTLGQHLVLFAIRCDPLMPRDDIKRPIVKLLISCGFFEYYRNCDYASSQNIQMFSTYKLKIKVKIVVHYFTCSRYTK